MGLLQRIRGTWRNPKRGSVTDLESYITQLQSVYNGYGYAGYQQTLAGQPAERIPNDLMAYSQQVYAANGPIFALMAVRMLAFSSIRFQFQRLNNGRPSGLFGTRDLSILETPWIGGTTQDLLTRMITDADLAGNAYLTIQNGELVRLRPDWVYIVLEPRYMRGSILGYKRVGYVYQELGIGSSQHEPIPIALDEMAHFAPHPDPLAAYRGMSWITPVIREVVNDKMMGRHQQKFFENGATPNLMVSMDAAVKHEDFLRFREAFKTEYAGVDNAYKTMVLGGGADVSVVGANFEQMAFTSTQGRIETRLAAAARVPVTIVGFSEGLQGSSLNSGNFREARKELADMTMHPLWQNACGSLQNILHVPLLGNSARLWYDARDVPFLREDAKDAAEINKVKASTISVLIQSGYEADSVVQAVLSEDFSLLKHTGLFSVQLQPPLTKNPQAIAPPPPKAGAKPL
jgi:phage portal protein BeeE